jgi:uncharacterized protein (TIGR03643 family)
MSNKLKINKFSEEDIDRIIQMAWEDRTTFDVIEKQFGIKQDAVIRIMRKHMKRKSFEIWRKRTSGRKTKHKSLVEIKLPRFKSSDQK